MSIDDANITSWYNYFSKVLTIFMHVGHMLMNTINAK